MKHLLRTLLCRLLFDDRLVTVLETGFFTGLLECLLTFRILEFFKFTVLSSLLGLSGVNCAHFTGAGCFDFAGFNCFVDLELQPMLIDLNCLDSIDSKKLVTLKIFTFSTFDLSVGLSVGPMGFGDLDLGLYTG